MHKGLHLAIWFLLAMLCALPVRAASTEMCFVQISDLHICNRSSANYLSRAVEWLNDPRTFGSHKPAFVAVTGDLSDSGAKDELWMCRTALSKLRVPWYPIPGNHDCMIHGIHTAYDDVFPDRERYAFSLGGYRFLFDSGSMYAITSTKRPRFDKWLASEIASTPPGRDIVVFTHYPYGNHVKFAVGPSMRKKVVDVLHQGHVLAVLSGHYHGDTTRTESGILYKTVPCLSGLRHNLDSSPHGVTLYVIQGSKITAQFIPFLQGR
jgi:3',5'-cyclic AMP phosphodiesterase CpdA